MTELMEKLLVKTCKAVYKLNVLDTEIILNFVLSEASHTSDITVDQYVWFIKFFDEIIQQKKKKTLTKY